MVFAQPGQGRLADRMAARRAAFITQRLNLTEAEAQQFWPIFNDYTQKVQQIRAGVKAEKPLDEMADADIEKIILADFDRDARELDLKKEYFQKLKKVISVRKIGKLYRAERDFKKELLEDLQEMRQQRKELRRN
jgi:Spy/CpxP family protein refolding chaperone